MSIEENIIYGVVAGIITSALIFLLVQVFNKIVIPWYRTVIYSGLDISGEWEQVEEHLGATDISKLIINQTAQSLSGLMTVVKQHNDSEETEIKTFIVKGEFLDGHVMLYGKSMNNKYRGHVTYLLTVTRAGKSLTGCTSWVDSGNDSISSSETVLVRKNT